MWFILEITQNQETILVPNFFLFLAQQPRVGQGLIIHEISRSHKTTHHSR